MEKLRDKQSLVMTIADLIIETFAVESGLIRALEIAKQFGSEKTAIPQAMVEAYVAEKIPNLINRVRISLFNIGEGNEKENASYQKALGRLLEPYLTSVEVFKEKIAARMLEREAFIL